MIAVLSLAAALLAAPARADEAPPEPAVDATAPTADSGDPAALADPGDAHITAEVVVRVSDKEAALAAAIAAATDAGGWFSSLSPDGVQLKVPRADVHAVVAAASALGEVADESFRRTDLTAQMGDLRGRLASREKVLDKYMEVLETASPKAVISAEREVVRLVSEIESLSGQLRVLEARSAYADVSVAFRFRERQAPARDGRSSFGWINRLNVADLVEDFESGLRSTRSAASAEAPAGFAEWRKPGRFQAVSPDGVVYRVRSERHRPRADLAFWSEAVRERMVGAGYKLLSEGPVRSADGTDGVLFELGAANGPRDLTYLVALFDSGRRLVVVEAAGDADAVRERKAALTAAISQLTL